MKAAIIFPGMGYHSDKPLLYYASKIAVQQGYKLLKVDYGEIEAFDRNEHVGFEKATFKALHHCERQIEAWQLENYESLVFISKSIGTVVGGLVGENDTLPIKHICYTPLEETFCHAIKEGIVFHGTNDPWARTEVVKNQCEKAQLPLYLFEGANHSLETENVINNIEILKKIMEQTKRYLEEQ